MSCSGMPASGGFFANATTRRPVAPSRLGRFRTGSRRRSGCDAEQLLLLLAQDQRRVVAQPLARVHCRDSAPRATQPHPERVGLRELFIQCAEGRMFADRKSTRLNSSHSQISYAVFCLKKKKTNTQCHEYTTTHTNTT